MCDVTSCLDACGLAWGKNEFEGWFCECKTGVLVDGFGYMGRATRSGCGRKKAASGNIARSHILSLAHTSVVGRIPVPSIQRKIPKRSLDCSGQAKKPNPTYFMYVEYNIPCMLKRCQALFFKEGSSETKTPAAMRGFDICGAEGSASGFLLTCADCS